MVACKVRLRKSFEGVLGWLWGSRFWGCGSSLGGLGVRGSVFWECWLYFMGFHTVETMGICESSTQVLV